MSTERKERDAPVLTTNSSVEQATHNGWGAQRHELLRWMDEKENTDQFLGHQMAHEIISGPRK